jgi:hypothetical protein
MRAVEFTRPAGQQRHATRPASARLSSLTWPLRSYLRAGDALASGRYDLAKIRLMNTRAKLLTAFFALIGISFPYGYRGIRWRRASNCVS